MKFVSLRRHKTSISILAVFVALFGVATAFSECCAAIAGQCVIASGAPGTDTACRDCCGFSADSLGGFSSVDPEPCDAGAPEAGPRCDGAAPCDAAAAPAALLSQPGAVSVTTASAGAMHIDTGQACAVLPPAERIRPDTRPRFIILKSFII